MTTLKAYTFRDIVTMTDHVDVAAIGAAVKPSDEPRHLILTIAKAREIMGDEEVDKILDLPIIRVAIL